MNVGPASKVPGFLPLLVAAGIALAPGQLSAETLEIGIGTQNTTTNTVTGGVVHQGAEAAGEAPAEDRQVQERQVQARLAELHLRPADHQRHDGQQAADRHDGRLPAAGERRHRPGQPSNETQLVAIIAYNAFGAGNGVVVHKDSPLLRARRPEGQAVSVPFGSAAHGMMLQADAGARLAGRFLEPRQPEPRSRHHQPAGKEDRRARRLRAVRRAAAVPRLRAQDLRRRRDQGADLPRRRRAQGLRREVSRGRRRLHQGADRGQRLGAQESEAAPPRRSRSGPRSRRKSSTSSSARAASTRSTRPSSRAGSTRSRAGHDVLHEAGPR